MALGTRDSSALLQGLFRRETSVTEGTGYVAWEFCGQSQYVHNPKTVLQ